MHLNVENVALLIAGGFVGGIGNALSGGGSFLTFPILMWLGLPPQVANAIPRSSPHGASDGGGSDPGSAARRANR